MIAPIPAVIFSFSLLLSTPDPGPDCTWPGCSSWAPTRASATRHRHPAGHTSTKIPAEIRKAMSVGLRNTRGASCARYSSSVSLLQKHLCERKLQRRSARRKHRPPATLRVNLPVSSRALCGSRRRPESDRVSTAELMGLRRQHIEDR